MITEQDHILISQYLDGELSPEERAIFDEKRANSEEFAGQVKLQKTILAAWKAKEKADLMNEFRQMNAAVQDEKPVVDFRARPRFRARAWLLAAAVAGILMVLSVYLLLPGETPESRLFAENFRPPPSQLLRGASVGDLQQAEALFNQKEYKAAIPKFKVYLSVHPGEPGPSLFLGASHLALNKPDSAIQAFQSAVYPDSGSYPEHFRWYLSLAYLSQNNREKAIPGFKWIAEQGKIYIQKAQAILKELE